MVAILIIIIIADSVVDLLKLKLESKLKFSKKLYITRWCTFLATVGSRQGQRAGGL